MKKVELESIVSIKDYRNLVYFNSIGKKKPMKYAFTLAISFAIIYLVYSLVTGTSGGLDVFSGAALGYLLFVVLSALILEKNIRKFAKEEDTLIGKKQQIIIRDNGVKVSNHLSTNGESYNWNQVLNTYFTKKYIYIYMNNGQIIVINKSLVSSDEIEFIREKTNSAQKKEEINLKQ